MSDAGARTEASNDSSERPAPPRPAPEIRRIGISDVGASLAKAARDFRNAPGYALFFGLFYASGGWLIIAMLYWLSLPYLAYPMAMGFALIAPFVVTGLYDVSRRLERGEPLSWSSVLGSVWDTRRKDLRWMAIVTAFTLVIWLDIAALMFFGFLGFKPLDGAFFRELFTTPGGLLFLLIGNVTGAIIAFFVFSISVISFPMLFDRDVDFVTAMTSSVKSVAHNPVPMALWCITIAILVAISIASAFVALIVVLPLLGHASWHLYRAVIAPEG